ncbi:MAG: ATP-grasp domain-containing protein [bacterium]|nr:MAG: ATP-grasp domain-containing protein [bacterium]
MSAERVLVVGTTTDYVDMIRRRYPKRVLFITDEKFRLIALEPPPPADEEIVADLGDDRKVSSALREHLERHGTPITGVACYDDESLRLASVLAASLHLPFATEKAIWTSRSKFHSKRAWHQAEVACPRVQTARDEESLEGALDRLGLPVVLKPMTGSGSELVFWCRSRDEARKAFRLIHRKLVNHPDARMYPNRASSGQSLDPRQDVVVEEGFSGPEFSCDFLLEEGGARLIRISGKVMAPGMETGTTLVYYIPANGDVGLGPGDLEVQLASAAQALGFGSGIFMADFILEGGRAYFLEVSPRPSGDCLPWLIRASSGLDTMGLALDVAQNRKVKIPGPEAYRFMAALRLFAARAGTFKGLDTSALEGDPRVQEVVVYRKPGHQIVLPPTDYFSRILGHVIFRPEKHSTLAEEAAAIQAMAGVDIQS